MGLLCIAVMVAVNILLSVDGGKVSLLVKDVKTPLTHLYLDFDKTITVDDFSVDVRKLFCKGQKYPNCDCSWLPNGKCDGKDTTSVYGMAKQLKFLPGGAIAKLTHSLGGEERLNKLRSWLNRMRKLTGGNVYIVSTSWYPVTDRQWHAYLLKVSELLNLGFDRWHIMTLGDPGPGLPADKGSLIKKHMRLNGVSPAAAMLVDDSKSSMVSAKDVCNTLYINKREGMDDTDCQYIEAIAGGLAFMCYGGKC